MYQEPQAQKDLIEVVKGRVTVWRPWQLKQLELFQKVAISTPSRQHFTQEYLLVSAQSGAIEFQYRNTRISGPAVDGTLVVFEPGETWISQAKDVTSYLLSIDPAWLQRIATELFQREQSLPHFPSHPLSVRAR